MVLNQHRVAYKFVEGELVSFESDQLMQEVVEPSLRLLVGDKFKAAHHAYMDALKEISNGKPDDAITDAGRALQQTLMALGCEGDVLSQLIADAKSKDLFRSHDQQLHEALILVMRWAASERNKLGDAHEGGRLRVGGRLAHRPRCRSAHRSARRSEEARGVAASGARPTDPMPSRELSARVSQRAHLAVGQHSPP